MAECPKLWMVVMCTVCVHEFSSAPHDKGENGKNSEKYLYLDNLIILLHKFGAAVSTHKLRRSFLDDRLVE